jgi:hypothetical protein
MVFDEGGNVRAVAPTDELRSRVEEAERTAAARPLDGNGAVPVRSSLRVAEPSP